MATSPLVTTATAQLHELIGSVTADDLDSATPCSEWTVGELVDHVVNVTDQLTTMARGEQVDWSAPTPHHDDPVSAFRANADELLAALADGDASSMPADWQTSELSVHAWDLATALGRGTDHLDPAVAEAGLGFMSESLTDEQRGDSFGPERPAPDGANAYDRIAAFAGRTVG